MCIRARHTAQVQLTVVARGVADPQQALASLATRGQQQVTYLRRAEVKPAWLALAAATPGPRYPPRKRRRATTR